MSPPSPFTCMPSAADRLAYLCSLRDYVPETPRHSAFLLDHLRERFWLEKDHDCVVATIQLVAHLIAEHPSPSATAAAAAVAYNIANDFKQWLKRSVSIGLVDDVVGERRNTRSLSADWYPTSVSRKNSEDQGRDSKAAHKTVVSSTVIIRTLLRALYRIGLQTKAGVYHNSHPRPLSTSSSSFPSLSSASLSALSPPPSTSPLPFSQLPWFAQLMQHPSAAIREDCLSLLASTSPLPRLASLQQAHATRKLLHTIAEFVADPHPRVRAGSLLALIRLHMRGARLDVHLYRKALRALKAEETDERVRILGMHLLWVLACIHPNHAVGFYQGEPICMVDDVFTKICIKVNDVSTKVRVAACTLLGRFQGVERNRVLQTFSKKPLDELSRDRALAVDKGKQKARVGARTSLFWLPEGDVSLEQASLDHGWAGAFIHAWEDEFLEVRIAAISSLCEIGIRSPSLYAAKALQMMVEMFNDDSKEVRLEAINSVARLGELVHLSDEHVSIVLLAFEDTASSIRRAVMRLFSRMHLFEPVRFSLIVSALTAGMQRYPCDVQPIYRTLQSFGAHQPHMTEFTLPSLLASPLPPPSVSTPNARVEKPVAYDRRYIGRLIVVYNAAIKHNAIFAHLAPHYKEQFLYLARQYPGFFPPSVYLTPSLAADADRRAMAGRDVRAQLQRFVSTIRSLLAQSFALSPRTAAASKVSSTPRALCLSSSYMRQLSRSLQHIHRQLYSVLLTTAPSSLPPSPSSSLSSQASMDNHALAFFLVDYTAALLLILDLLPVLVRFYTHALHVSSPSSSSPTADTTDPGEVAPAVRQKITRAKYCLMHILARYQGLSVGWRHHSTRWVLVLSLYSCKLDLDRQLQQQRQQPHFARASVSLNQDFLQSLHVLLSLSDGTESTSAFPFYLQRNVLLWARHRHNLGPSSNGITGDSNGHGCGEYNKNDIDAEERVSKKRKIDSVPNVPGTFSVSSSAAAAMPSPPPSVSKVLASLLASALLPDRVHDLELNRTRAVLSEPQCDPTRVLWLSTSAVCPVCIPVRFSMQHVYDTSRIRIVISFCPPASCSSSSPYRAGDLIFTPAAADCSALSAPDSVLSDWSVHSIIELTLPHIRQLKATNESRTASSESVCKAKDSVISGRHDEHKNSNNSNNNINNNNYNYNNNNNNNNNDDGSFVVYVSIASLFHCSDDCSSSPASMQAYDIPHGIVASSTASSSLFASVNSVLAGLNDGHNVLVPVSRALALRVRVT